MFRIAEVLLKRAFVPAPTAPAALTPTQHRVLAELLVCDLFWDAEGNVFAPYMLPASRDALRDWLVAVPVVETASGG